MTAAIDIRLHVLEKITNNFSPDFKIGSGGYGDVYKGVLSDGELVAVKLLHDTVEGLDGKLFKNEVGNLLMVDHPNIVQFLGYCYETQSKYVEYNGANVFGKHIRRVLCFEYLQGGSLDKRLPEKYFAPDWSTRYNIIKGVCEGLNFLHARENPIFHLDLKPGNILLDSFMVPKLADFGLSRLISESHTHVTKKRIGTDKYMPPEYRNGGNISVKNDVFSLGVVMIDIMEGPKGYFLFHEIGETQFKKKILAKWSSMIEPTTQYRPQLLLQVKTCIDIALRCVESDRNVRPTIATILDTLTETEAQIPIKKITVVPLSLTIDIKSSLAETLKKLTVEPNNITNSVANMDQVPNTREATSNVEEPFINEENEDRETSSYVEEGIIIGRTEETNKILSILSESSTKEMVILPIYGIGGIGKTTLAQLVFNDTQFTGYSQVWVYVSEKLDLYKIGNSIISQLSKGDSNITNMQIIHNRLGELFADKSILIVLDDLWEDKSRELDKLKSMLRLGKGRKVIIVTTRDEAIARKICSTVKSVPYKLEILTDDMCWFIIKQKSDFENRPGQKQLEHIGRDIAIRCGGVALAAQSVGYMLRDMSSDQWESVRDSDIWNLSTSEDPSLTTHEVLASLRLSYSHMHKFLQLCFSYCAVFPKGHIIAKYDLIYQWIALGFPQPSEIFDSMQLCEKYVTQLLGMSFLQYSNTQRGELHTKNFTMHDLVHDLARAMLADKVKQNGNVRSSCQYAFLTDPSEPMSSPEKMKALHLEYEGETEDPDGIFSRAKNLLVLDIKWCRKEKLLNCIGKLKQLRYLHAQWIPDQRITKCISELSELNYLNLKGSRIKVLPDSIGCMKGLMYLDLSDCEKLSELPASFADLKQLVHLDLSNCPITISKSWGTFTKLQHLNLSRYQMDWVLRSFLKDNQDSNVLPEVIGKLTKLQYLSLAFFTEFDRTNVLLEAIRKLNKLQYLNLAGCMDMMPADIHSLLVGISTLYNLEHLDVSESGLLNSIPESIGNLTKLHTLDLSNCNIQNLPAWMAKMASLKIVNMTTVHECISNLNLLLLVPNPHELKISKLEDVKSLEEARSVKLIEKWRIGFLTLEWTIGCHKRFVDDKDVLEVLVPPDYISTLHISGYSSPSFPTNWIMDIGQYLPNVVSITLEDLPSCNSLPPLSQLPNLEYLRLHRLGSLEELINTADSCGECMFPKLHFLDIKSCPKLRLKPCVPRALLTTSINSGDNNMLTSQTGEVIQCLPYLRSLHLKDDILTELPTWLLQLKSLKQLIVEGCGSMVSLPQWFGELSSLKELYITECKGISSLPGSIRQLTKLEILSINRYHMHSYNLRKMFSLISSDTDEVNIRKLIEDYENNTSYSNMDEEEMEGEYTEEYMYESIDYEESTEEHEEDTNIDVASADANAASLVRSSSALSTQSGSPTENLSANTDEINILDEEDIHQSTDYGEWTEEHGDDINNDVTDAHGDPGVDEEHEDDIEEQILPKKRKAKTPLGISRNLDTASGSGINCNGAIADVHGDPGVDTAAVADADANTLVLVPSLSALSIESGLAAKVMSDHSSEYVTNTSSHEGVAHKHDVEVRYNSNPGIQQLVQAASAAATNSPYNSSGTKINNSAVDVMSTMDEVDVQDLFTSFSTISTDSGFTFSATKRLSGFDPDLPADVGSPSTHNNMVHEGRVGIRHTWTRRPQQQRVAATSAATANSLDPSSGSRVNCSGTALIIPANVLGDTTVTNVQDIISSFFALSSDSDLATWLQM